MTKTEQTRVKTWRLKKVLQHAAERSRNVARTCRYFGISRQAFYKWKRRYEAYGEASLYDRSRTPQLWRSRVPMSLPAHTSLLSLYLHPARWERRAQPDAGARRTPRRRAQRATLDPQLRAVAADARPPDRDLSPTQHNLTGGHRRLHRR